MERLASCGQLHFPMMDQQADSFQMAKLCLGKFSPEIKIQIHRYRAMLTDLNLQQVIDRANIINTIHRFLLSVDTRDYAAMRTCLTDEVNFDYESTVWHLNAIESG